MLFLTGMPPWHLQRCHWIWRIPLPSLSYIGSFPSCCLHICQRYFYILIPKMPVWGLHTLSELKGCSSSYVISWSYLDICTFFPKLISLARPNHHKLQYGGRKFLDLDSLIDKLIISDRWCHWSSMSLQMCFRQISYATLLHSPWGADLYFWRTLDVWSYSTGPSYFVGPCAQCGTYEVCWGWWVTWSCSNSTWLSDRPLFSFLGVT